MSPPCHLVEEPDRWVVTNLRSESLTITIEAIHVDISHQLGTGPGALEKDGVEADLQRLLAQRPEILAAGPPPHTARVPDRYRSPLTCSAVTPRAVRSRWRSSAGERSTAVEQLTRYLQRLDGDGRLRPVRGDPGGRTGSSRRPRALAAARGITCVEVDYDALRGNRAG